MRITYRIFQGVDQPQPSAGPLAETVRSILDLQPDDLAARHDQLRERLFADLGRPAETGAGQ